MYDEELRRTSLLLKILGAILVGAIGLGLFLASLLPGMWDAKAAAECKTTCESLRGSFVTNTDVGCVCELEGERVVLGTKQ